MFFVVLTFVNIPTSLIENCLQMFSTEQKQKLFFVLISNDVSNEIYTPQTLKDILETFIGKKYTQILIAT